MQNNAMKTYIRYENVLEIKMHEGVKVYHAFFFIFSIMNNSGGVFSLFIIFI
jgi:hypothetical protein